MKNFFSWAHPRTNLGQVPPPREFSTVATTAQTTLFDMVNVDLSVKGLLFVGNSLAALHLQTLSPRGLLPNFQYGHATISLLTPNIKPNDFWTPNIESNVLETRTKF